MITRPRLPREQRLTIKSYLRTLLQAVGPLKVAAAETGVSDVYLSRCARPNEDDLPSLEVVLLLERAAGAPLVSSHLPEFAASAATVENAPLTAHDCASLTREACDAITCLAQASADGDITPNEREALKRELDELIKAAQAARKKLVAGLE